MRKITILCFFLAALSVVSGVLLSKSSFIGKVGIHFFYQQYKFLRIWWQGALVIFCFLLLLVGIHLVVRKMLDFKTARFTYLLALAVALVGLYLTYLDFRQSLSHRLLGERFHIGAYLFWLGWISINIFFLVDHKKRMVITELNDQLKSIN